RTLPTARRDPRAHEEARLARGCKSKFGRAPPSVWLARAFKYLTVVARISAGIRTGNYYFKKDSYRAAAGRFAEATRWNSGEPEAWLRLGEAEEKLKDKKAAHDAYEKYLELASGAKNAEEVRKKLEKLK